MKHHETPLGQALEQLDHNNDDHWTDNGLPSVSAVKELVSHGKEQVTRQAITDTWPDLTRTSAAQAAVDGDPETDDDVSEPENPIDLMERAWNCAQTARFRRNSTLYQLLQAFSANSEGIREMQERVDQQLARRAARQIDDAADDNGE